MRLRASGACLLILACAGATSANDDPVGLYAGGGVGGVVQGNAVGEIFLGRWWDSFGVEGGISIFKSKLDLDRDDFDGDDVKVEDTFSVRAGLTGKAGVGMGRAKPYVALGVRYEHAESESSLVDNKRDFVYIVPSLGVDVRAAEHIVLGIVFVSVPVVVHGKNNDKGDNAPFGNIERDGDFEGFSVQFLSSFSVSYLF